MRKRILVILMALGPLFLSAQENSIETTTEKTKVKEIGLLFPDLSNLGNLGLAYRFGSNKAVWRINSLFLSGSSTNEDQPGSSNTVIERNSFSTGFQFGRECRKPLGENFEFRLGGDISFQYRSTSSVSTSNTTGVDTKTERVTNSYSPGLNVVLGFNYVIKEQLVIGVEFLPGIHYSTNKENLKSTVDDNQFSESSSTSNSIQYGFNNYSGLLSLSYRF